MLVGVWSVPESTETERIVLVLPSIQIEKSETSFLGLSLKNSAPVEALQARFTYDSTIGFQVTGVNLTSRTAGFEPPAFHVDANDPEETIVSIVLFSIQGAAIRPGTGNIVTFQYQAASDAFGETRLFFTNTVAANSTVGRFSVDFQDGLVSTYHRELSGMPDLVVIPQNAVPEPSTVHFFSIGLPGLGVLIYWKRRRKQQE